jgi:hypothetical protein
LTSEFCGILIAGMSKLANEYRIWERFCREQADHCLPGADRRKGDLTIQASKTRYVLAGKWIFPSAFSTA